MSAQYQPGDQVTVTIQGTVTSAPGDAILSPNALRVRYIEVAPGVYDEVLIRHADAVTVERAYPPEHRGHVWQIGPYTFIEVLDHGYEDYAGRSLWRFEVDGAQTNIEMYPSLEYAMVAAVGEKYTGPRRAGGSGVGTAADWFMRMIGAEEAYR